MGEAKQDRRMELWRLPHYEEQILAAASMIPGILLAVWWSKLQSCPPNVAIACDTYIVGCIGSIVYHTHSAYNPGYHPRMLRMDISGQQLAVYSAAVLSPLGIRGALLVAPLAVYIGLADFAHIPSSYMALAAHALSILAISICGNVYTSLKWLGAFCVYASKDLIENSYTIAQCLWHILVHFNTASYWVDMASVSNP
jgi:hypothetical protein